MGRLSTNALGAVFSQKDIRDYKLAEPEEKFPKSFELTLGPVKNQYAIGSCVAHAIAETIEFHNSLQGNNDAMSVGYIYGNRRGSAHLKSGMIVRDALKNACSYGDIALVDFPENEEVPGIIAKFEERVDGMFEEATLSHFEKYYRVSSEEEIKTAIMSDGPVIFAMNWYDDFHVNASGILESTYKKENRGGGHCMVIYGWNQRGWLIRNSWGKYWGERGNATLPYEAPINEAWGIADDKSNTPIKKPYSTRFGKFIAKILNFIINLFYKVKE